jgi:hypothetical protein
MAEQDTRYDKMDSCDFSDIISGSQSFFSPNRRYIATITGTSVKIRDSNTYRVIQIMSCNDRVDKIEISPDSCYLLAAVLSRGFVQVFSIADPDWKCRLSEGAVGLVDAFWGPDSRSILTESDFGVQMTVWSLVDGSTQIITNPKQSHFPSLPATATKTKLSAFSQDGKFMALAHRIELHDWIGVYSTDPWGELSKFQSKTQDVSYLEWTPSGTHIVALDSILHYRMVVYTPAGDCVANFEAYHHALGVRTMTFPQPLTLLTDEPIKNVTTAGRHPALMALGSFDGKIRLLSARSFQPVFELPLVHPQEMPVGLTYPQVLDRLQEIEAEEASKHDPNASKILPSAEVEYGGIMVEVGESRDKRRKGDEESSRDGSTVAGGRSKSSFTAKSGRSGAARSERTGGGMRDDAASILSAATSARNSRVGGGHGSTVSARFSRASRGGRSSRQGSGSTVGGGSTALSTAKEAGQSVFLWKNSLRQLPRVVPRMAAAQARSSAGKGWKQIGG